MTPDWVKPLLRALPPIEREIVRCRDDGWEWHQVAQRVERSTSEVTAIYTRAVGVLGKLAGSAARTYRLVKDIELPLTLEELTFPPLKITPGGLRKKTVVVEASWHNLDLPVDNLDLSVRAANCLQNTYYSNAITYVGELVQRTPSEMCKIKNLGRRTFREIREVLGELGLDFNMDVGNWQVPSKGANIDG